MNQLIQTAVDWPTTTTVDHIAIAVPDLEAAIKWYRDTLGFTVVERRETQGNRTGMVSAVLRAGATTFVLVQGTSAESQVSRFVEMYGPGVQHVALAVEDLPSFSENLANNGVEFDTTIITSGGLRQRFLKRDPTSGVMIELIERIGGTFTDQSVEELFKQLEARDSF